MTRRRTLRPEEEDLWKAVARSARPMHPIGQRLAKPGPKPIPDPLTPAPPPPEAPLTPFRLGEKARPASQTALPPSTTPLQMDARSFARMSRGKLLPESRLDLHGMTLAEAHPALMRFILGAQGAGQRLVLVITGKGSRARADDGPIPQRPGVLRHQVPQWLRMPPLSAAVLEVAEAHARHGGAGALYVYLRRLR